MKDILPFTVMALIMLFLGVFSLVSCSGTLRGDVRDPITGVIVDDGGHAQVDQQTINTVFSKVRRLIKGDEVKDVLLEPSK